MKATVYRLQATVLLLVCAVCLIACGGTMPRSEHALTDINGVKCEWTKVQTDTGGNKDFSYKYKCDAPGGAPGDMYRAWPAYVIATPEAAAMTYAPSNPPPRVCQAIETTANDQVVVRVPECLDANKTRGMVIYPTR
ncbi:MAG: hypothetical protein WCW34_04150 [Patescibacteria group bacterium]|jgi:hypothetical protein